MPEIELGAAGAPIVTLRRIISWPGKTGMARPRLLDQLALMTGPGIRRVASTRESWWPACFGSSYEKRVFVNVPAVMRSGSLHELVVAMIAKLDVPALPGARRVPPALPRLVGRYWPHLNLLCQPNPVGL